MLRDLEDYRVYDYDEEPDAWAVCDLLGTPIAGPYGDVETAESRADELFEPGSWVVSPLYL